jgi:hypothetical protein
MALDPVTHSIAGIVGGALLFAGKWCWSWIVGRDVTIKSKRSSPATVGDIEELLKQSKGTNGATVLTKDAHARICGENLRPINETLIRIETVMKTGEDRFKSIDTKLQKIDDNILTIASHRKL